MCKEESTKKTEVKQHWFIKNINWIVLIIAILLFIIQWITINKNLVEIKNQRQKQTFRLDSITTDFIDLNSIKKDSLNNYIFQSSEIEKINSKLNNLSKHVFDERNNAEVIIDKDIDRLNLYMALGIGLLSLLGVFVPISVNILSKNDLEKKQERLDSDLNDLKSETEKVKSSVDEITGKDIDSAIKNANEALEKGKEIEKLKTSSDELIPKISIISLQIAIHRLFNVSSLISIKTDVEIIKFFKDLFQNIKVHLKLCQEDNMLKINESPIMQQTLKDFVDLMKNEGFKYTTYLTDNRHLDDKDLIKNIELLSNSNISSQEGNYNAVIQSFDDFIKEIEKTNA